MCIHDQLHGIFPYKPSSYWGSPHDELESSNWPPPHSPKGLWMALSWDLSCLILMTWDQPGHSNDGRFKGSNHAIMQSWHSCSLEWDIYIYISVDDIYIYIHTYIHTNTNDRSVYVCIIGTVRDSLSDTGISWDTMEVWWWTTGRIRGIQWHMELWIPSMRRVDPEIGRSGTSETRDKAWKRLKLLAAIVQCSIWKCHSPVCLVPI